MLIRPGRLINPSASYSASDSLSLIFDDSSFFGTTGRYGLASIVDSSNSANNYNSDPFNLISGHQIKMLRTASGLLAFQAHNLVLQSSDFSNASWQKLTGATVTGTTTLNDTNGAGASVLRQSVTLRPETLYTLSFRVLKDSVPDATRIPTFRLDDGVGGLHTVGLDTQDGIAVSVNGSPSSITVTDETTHWRLSFRAATSTSTSCLVEIYPACYFSIVTPVFGNNIQGSVTVDQVHLRYTDADTTFIETTSAIKSHLPFEWSAAGVLEGIATETARTQLIKYATAIEQVGGWSATEVTFTANNANTPVNRTISRRVTETTANNSHLWVDTSAAIVSGTTYTMSAFYKAGTATVVQIGGRSTPFGVNIYANFDLSNGTITATGSSVIAAKIEAYANGWYRCSVTGTAVGNATGGMYGALVNNNTSAARAPTYVGTSKTIQTFGHMLEAGRTASSYVTTGNNTVAKSADAITLATSNYPHSATVNSAMVRYRPLDVGTAMVALRWDDGTSNEVVSLGHDASANLGLTITDGGVAQTAPLTSGTATVNTWEKIACSFKANDFLFSDNGAAAVTDTSGTLPTVTSLDIGPTLNGHISHIFVEPIERTATEVATLAST